jgi:A/G-specific adenine glycosylase
MSGQAIAKLLSWYQIYKRPLPWRINQNPYQVLVSEIMLQQTRVDTVLTYYSKFIEAFPDQSSLAQAEESRILKFWEGLGYYQRIRNLQKTCQNIMTQYAGEFPKTSKELATLPGIGEYTSRAVASICFMEPVPVLDGNVFRVAARYFALSGHKSQSRVSKVFYDHLNSNLFDPLQPSESNQALMDLGATICVPSEPKCEVCPLQTNCRASQHQNWDQYPEKRPQPKKIHLNLYLFLGRRKSQIQWTLKPWKGYQKGFAHPLWVESCSPLNLEDLRERFQENWCLTLGHFEVMKSFTHQITRYSLQCHVVHEGYQGIELAVETPLSTLWKKATSKL